jgi:holo-[acyl-carrier protein] synthase
MRGILWRELEILNNPQGKPTVHLHGRAYLRAQHLRLAKFEISLTHSRELAIAFVVAIGD